MQTVLYGSNFNTNSLYVPDVYLEVIPPQAYYGGTPSSIGFEVGTASWGQKDTPILMNTPQGYIQAFGGITAAAVNDVHDLCTELNTAMNQVAGTAGTAFYAVRRTNGSDTAATVVLHDQSVSPQTGITISGKYTGTKGAEIAIVVQQVNGTSLVNVTVIPFAGGGQPELFTNLPASGTTFWAALQNAINNGQSAQRPASKFVVASGATTTTLAAVQGTFSLTGGNDGRTSITSGELLGSSSAQPSQGIYCAQSTLIKSSVLWVAGLSDDTVFSTIQAFCDLNNIMGCVALASGTDVPSACTQKQTDGIFDYQMTYLLGWHYIFDAVNGISRLIAPTAACCGAITALAPWASPMGIPIRGIIGTERSNSVTGVQQPYSYSELLQLSIAGICVIDNPTPLGPGFGFRNSCNSVGNYPQNPQSVIEYSRLTNWLVASVGQLVGPFIGKLQGTSPGDPTRAQVNTVLNTYLASLLGAYQIGGFLVNCGLAPNGPNSFQTIANHGLLIQVQVQYLASVLIIGVTLQGGTTVQVSTAAPGQQPLLGG